MPERPASTACARRIQARAAAALCLLLLVASCSTTPASIYNDRVAFSVEGGSYGDPRGVAYFVVLDDGAYDEATARQLFGYASYILNYRGLVESMYPEDSEYILVVSFEEYNRQSNRQVFQLMAGSRRIYESLGELRPSWIAASIHNGRPTTQRNMLALHALAIRDFAGGNPYPATGMRAYDRDSELISDIQRQVQSYIESSELLEDPPPESN